MGTIPCGLQFHVYREIILIALHKNNWQIDIHIDKYVGIDKYIKERIYYLNLVLFSYKKWIIGEFKFGRRRALNDGLLSGMVNLNI